MPAPLPMTAPAALAATPSPLARAMLAAGTPVYLSLDQDLTTARSNIGDSFDVTVLRDVVDGTTIVIPKGAIGHGEITYVGTRGGFGRAGLISIALRDIDLGERKLALDGIYREAGDNKTGATVATWVMVGVFSGVIKGNDVIIPKGRELKARTRHAFAYTIGAAPPAVARSTAQIAPAAGTATGTSPATQFSQSGPVATGAVETYGSKR